MAASSLPSNLPPVWQSLVNACPREALLPEGHSEASLRASGYSDLALQVRRSSDSFKQ